MKPFVIHPLSALAGGVVTLVAVLVASGASRSDVLEAKELVLRDDNGRPRLRISAGRDGSSIQFLDAAGSKRMALEESARAVGLTIHHDDGHNAAGVGLYDGMPGLSVNAKGGTGTAIVSVDPDRGQPSLSLTEKSSKARMTASTKGLAVYGDNGSTVVNLSCDHRGSGRLKLSDGAGHDVFQKPDL